MSGAIDRPVRQMTFVDIEWENKSRQRKKILMSKHQPPKPEDGNAYNLLEAQFVPKFLALFAQVSARQPEKGVKALILRARRQARQTGLPLETVLDQVYQDAVERTERRIQLLQRCELKQKER
jgi:lysine/ornithine N-monooxygenase